MFRMIVSNVIHHMQVYLEGLEKAMQHHAAVVDLAEAQALLPTGAVPPPIGEQGDAALAAADAAQVLLAVRVLILSWHLRCRSGWARSELMVLTP